MNWNMVLNAVTSVSMAIGWLLMCWANTDSKRIRALGLIVIGLYWREVGPNIIAMWQGAA